MYYMMLARFEDMSLIKGMKDIAKHVEELDYLNVKEVAHSIKGASGYVGAGPLHFACYFIQEHFLAGRFKE